MNRDCLICGWLKHGPDEDTSYHSIYFEMPEATNPDYIIKAMLVTAEGLNIDVNDIRNAWSDTWDFDSLMDIQLEIQNRINDQTNKSALWFDGTWYVYNTASSEFNAFNQEFKPILSQDKEMEVDLVLFKLLAFKDLYVEKEYINV